MNIKDKYKPLLVIFCFLTSNYLFSMAEEKPSKYTAEMLGFSRRVIKNVSVEDENCDVEIVEYEKPSVTLFGIPWFKKTYTMKESTNFTRATWSGASYRWWEVLNENPYELCLKTKVLLGTLMLAPVVGLGYYFNWFKRK